LGRVSRGERTGGFVIPDAGRHGTQVGQAMRQRTVIVRMLFIALAVLFGFVAVSGCSGDDDDAAADDRETATTTTAESTTTVDTTAAEEAAVTEARQAADDVWKAVTAPPEPNPDDPTIAAHYVGPMFDRLTETIRGLRANGWAIRYPEGSQARIEIQSIRFSEDDGEEVAFLEVCGVDDGERFDMASGDVLEGGVRTLQLTEAMRKVDGEWKLAERRQNDYQEGVVECAAGQ
jgi:hypothetical protein